MPCYQPLKAFVIGVKENGKKDLKIYGNKVDHIELMSNGSYKPALSYTRTPSAYKVIREFIEVPCGRCIGCRLQKSKDWANRCLLELDYHESSYFVTLSYDNEHVHHSEFINDDGVVTDILTCKKRDFQLFMKRLRKAFPEQFIRYFACTEYGETTARPHCHAILFGLKLDDLRPIKVTELGDTLYTSDTLASIWQNGIVSLGEVTWESCAYAARYVAKNIVAAGLADRAEVELAYAIGVPFPVSIYVDTFGTEKVQRNKIVAAVEKVFDCTPAGIIKTLNLKQPIYRKTASYGHFGREGFPWEATDKVEALKAEIKEEKI